MAKVSQSYAIKIKGLLYIGTYTKLAQLDDITSLLIPMFYNYASKSICCILPLIVIMPLKQHLVTGHDGAWCIAHEME